MSEARGQGYVAAHVGALLGAAIVVVVAFVAFQVFVLPSLFQEHRPLEVWGISSVSGCVIGAVVGCAVALRRRGHLAVGTTALLLLVVLLGNLALMLWSAETWLQSALHPYGFALALVSPLIARAVAVRVARPGAASPVEDRHT